jgi:hypothetical protein
MEGLVLGVVGIGGKTARGLVGYEAVGLSREVGLSGYLDAGVGLGGFAGEQFVDVVVDDDFVEADGFPAEGTVGLALKTAHTVATDGVVHGADDDGLARAAVVVVEADVALAQVAELLVDGARPVHIYQ